MTDAAAERLTEIVATVLGISHAEAGAASADSVPTWDSLAHLNLIMAVEQEFGIQFAAELIPELDSVNRIRQAIEVGAGSEA
jgi:acyl carrier protein